MSRTALRAGGLLLGALLLGGCALLAGCSLAREEGADAGDERLIGVYVTREYLDLFDTEAYLNDNISRLMGNDGQVIENTGAYEGRLYAELVPVPQENGGEGTARENWEYIFSGVEGFHLYATKITPPGEEGYYTVCASEAFSQPASVIGGATSLEATLYLAPGSAGTLYVNPMYQGGDGRVFLMSGNGYNMGEAMVEGAEFTATLEEKHTRRENGAETDESVKITVHMAVKSPPVQVSLVEMSAGHEMLARRDFAPDNLPQQVQPAPGAAYVVVETRSAGTEGELLHRELLEPEAQGFTSYRLREDGILEGGYVELGWK